MQQGPATPCPDNRINAQGLRVDEALLLNLRPLVNAE